MWLSCAASCVTLIGGPYTAPQGNRAKTLMTCLFPSSHLTCQPLQEPPGKKSLGHYLATHFSFSSPPGPWRQGAFSYSLFGQDTPQGHILSPPEMVPAAPFPELSYLGAEVRRWRPADQQGAEVRKELQKVKP